MTLASSCFESISGQPICFRGWREQVKLSPLVINIEPAVDAESRPLVSGKQLEADLMTMTFIEEMHYAIAELVMVCT